MGALTMLRNSEALIGVLASSAPAGATRPSATSAASEAKRRKRTVRSTSLILVVDDEGVKRIILELVPTVQERQLDEERHADEAEPLPTPEEATRSLDFAMALGQFLFVLPARVQKGLGEVKPAV